MLKQVTLDPWLPGGFIDIWIRWIAARSPDYVEKKLDVWKILGGCLLNTACKVIANVEPVRTGNMLIALIGPSGSIKSWALTSMRIAAPDLTIPAGTPEYLLESISEQRNGVVYETEIGTVMKAAEAKGGYMRAWGDVMNKIYDLDALEAGRRKAKSVFVAQRSYYVSVCIAGTPKDYAGIFNLWPGLRRRFLMLNMKEVAPPRIWEPTSLGLEACAKIQFLLDKLQNHMIFLKLKNIDVINEAGRKIIGDAVTQRKGFEYLVKLFYALICDNVAVVVSNLRGELRPGIAVNNFQIDSLLNTPIKTDDVPIPLLMFKPMINSLQINAVSVVSVDCRQFKTDIRQLTELLNRQLLTAPPTIEGPVREYVEFFEDVRELLSRRQWITLRDICRLRNWPKQKALVYLDSMTEAGYVIVRKKGRSTVVLDPALKICGTCARFRRNCPLDPRNEGFVEIFDEPCEDYAPFFEEEPLLDNVEKKENERR